MAEKPIPLKIELCPIIEAVVDFRFDTTYPADAIFGMLYKYFRDEFTSEVEKLPILQIPEQIRMQDQNLIYQPYYRLRDGDFLMQIGPRVISFVNVNDYMGWDRFFSRIKSCLRKIGELDLSLVVKRMGLRYVNFFAFDVFKRITLNILMEDRPISAKHTSIRTVLQTGDYQTNLNIMNNTSLMRHGRLQTGSVLDIDTYIEAGSIDLFAKPDMLIGNAHTEEKKLFYKLLNDDLVQEMKPTYEARA